MKIKKISQTAGTVGIVEDNLDSTSTVNGLSANQGRVLDEKIDDLDTNVGDTSTLTTTSSEVVGSINELDAEIGDTSTLETEATTVVGAINENKGNIDDLEDINIMTAYLASNYSYTAITSDITLTEYNSVGSKLTISSGGIKIGSGISKIKLSGVVSMVYNSPATYNLLLRIFQNTTKIITIYGVKRDADKPACVTLPPILLDVSENDVFKMNIYAADDTNIVSGATQGISTFLTAEVVE